MLTALAGCSGGGGGGSTSTGSLIDTDATVQSIQITPSNPHLAVGTTTQLTATAVFSDSSHQDVTATVSWASSNMQAATVSKGLATALTAGSTTITASAGRMQAQTTLAVTPAVLVSIEVTPPAPSIAKGTTAQFTAMGVFSDKSTQDLTSQVTWASANGAVASISSAAGSAGLASAGGVGSTNISASMNGITSGNAALTVTAATLVSIQVTPPTPSIANGLMQQFTAMGLYTDHSTQDLTSMATWASSSTGVAGISNSAGSAGLATAAGVGTSSISASFGGVSSPMVTLTVTPATLVSIQVTPPTASIANGTTQQFTATGLYTDNSTQDLTALATWASDTGTVAGISNAGGSNGLATALAVGSANINASYVGVTSPGVALTVTPATLVSIQVDPPSASIAKGLTQQFTATGTYTDKSTQDLTAFVTWASDTGTVAGISNAGGSNGLATALAVGSANINASYVGVTSPGVALTVTPATLVSIQVTPASPSIAKGLTQQFAATGTYTDNSTQDLTALATWSSDTTGVASISNAGGSNGLATAMGVGQANIGATYSGVTSPNVALTVTAATLVSIQVNPPGASLANGLTQQFTATGTYTDNSTQDLTALVTWASDTGTVASISNAGGSNGLATALAVGSANISAGYSGVTSPSVVLTVTAATLVSIQVTPATPSIAKGLTQQFAATGTYTDNSTQDLTASATWASDTTGVASISNVSGTNGLATGMGVGSANISASYNGVTSPSVMLTVTAATLVSIQVTPPGASIAMGLTQQFAATGFYTDNSTQDLTTTATWASDTASVASISNASGTNGLASTAGIGTSNITAASGAVVSPAVTLTVTPATLASIQVNPASPSIAKGLTQQFTATGTYTDTSTQDLTGSVTWASDATGVASISNVSGTNGLATGVGVGSANISASFSGVTSPNVALTVTAAALVSIEVAPASVTTAKGLTQQFSATGTYTDNSTQDLTTAATWVSATTSVASISNAAGSNGLATALAAGSSNISAAYLGVTSPAAVLTVVSPTATAGIWTATPAAGTTAFMISDGAGNIYFYTSTSTCLALSNGTVLLSGSTLLGSGYYVPDVFGPKTGCAAEYHEIFSGTLVQDSSMKLTGTPTGGTGSTVTINWTFDPLYYQPSALSLVAGTWKMADGTTVTVSSTGTLSAHDTTTGCTITGKLSVSNTTVDVYNVTAKYTTCTGSASTLNGASLSGLGTLDASVTPNQFTALVRSSNKKTMSLLSFTR